jgi:hypothetical protein
VSPLIAGAFTGGNKKKGTRPPTFASNCDRKGSRCLLYFLM